MLLSLRGTLTQRKQAGMIWLPNYQRMPTSLETALFQKKYAPDPVLGLWVSEQRTAKRERRLNQDQVQELEKIGFSWQPQNSCGSAFMIGLRKLEEFRDTFNHVNVPSDFEDEDLVKYVAAQRLAKAKGKLSDKRIGYLDGMGFDWEG
mmetsp:Transcript_13553/g.30355  ORF Transcript_13553/g.30355 Transcript_13553/m.30355 type:complete len:148 (-) Transcript_13553:265-708(-)